MHDFPTPAVKMKCTSIPDDDVLEQIRIRTHLLAFNILDGNII